VGFTQFRWTRRQVLAKLTGDGVPIAKGWPSEAHHPPYAQAVALTIIQGVATIKCFLELAVANIRLGPTRVG
jgi:hypothetical protein